MQGSIGSRDSAGYVRPPDLLANCDAPARLERNVLEWRNVFSGPILSLHTGGTNGNARLEAGRRVRGVSLAII